MELKTRKIFAELLRQKDDRKISFLVGPRQIGKTTLLKQLHNEICLERKNHGVFLDLDIFTNFEKTSTFENLVNLLKLNGYDESGKDRFYLFLDEFQRYSDLSIVMKNAYDNLANVKIYASGSSSLEIKDKIRDSLAGRKKVNTIYALDFEEFLHFKDEDRVIAELKNTRALSGAGLEKAMHKTHGLLEEFLIFGGYPEVVLQKVPEKKIGVLESIFDLYIKKDLSEYLKIKDIAGVKKLIEYLAINNGQKIKYEEIGKTASLGFKETKGYIEILKETYIVTELRPFFTNKNKELVKIPKIYFIDSGVRNYFIKNFNPARLRSDAGYLFEGHVVSEMLKKGASPDSMNFWQDKNRHEVDLILEKTPIEIKYKKDPGRGDEVGLKAFLQEYPETKKAFLVNLGTQKKHAKIHYSLPYHLHDEFSSSQLSLKTK